MFVFINVSKPFALIFFSGFYADPQNACNQPHLLMMADIGEISERLAFLLFGEKEESIVYELVYPWAHCWKMMRERFELMSIKSFNYCMGLS